MCPDDPLRCASTSGSLRGCDGHKDEGIQQYSASWTSEAIIAASVLWQEW